MNDLREHGSLISDDADFDGSHEGEAVTKSGEHSCEQPGEGTTTSNICTSLNVNEGAVQVKPEEQQQQQQWAKEHDVSRYEAQQEIAKNREMLPTSLESELLYLRQQVALVSHAFQVEHAARTCS